MTMLRGSVEALLVASADGQACIDPIALPVLAHLAVVLAGLLLYVVVTHVQRQRHSHPRHSPGS
jgi:hypothetical protein